VKPESKQKTSETQVNKITPKKLTNPIKPEIKIADNSSPPGLENSENSLKVEG
jgi:hypothetical protein